MVSQEFEEPAKISGERLELKEKATGSFAKFGRRNEKNDSLEEDLLRNREIEVKPALREEQERQKDSERWGREEDGGCDVAESFRTTG